MSRVALMFRATAVVIFAQLVLGGLLTFGFISPASHIVVGAAVLLFAVATAVVAWTAKPSFRPIRAMSAILVLLILVQVVLGFATLGSGSQVLAWLHLVNALGIYGLAISGNFAAMGWERFARHAAASAPTGTREGN